MHDLSDVRVVILNQDPRASFHQILHGFPGSAAMDAPFFWKRQYIQEVTKKFLAVPLLNILPPKCGQIPKKSANFKGGVFWRKVSNARGNMTKTSGVTQIIFFQDRGYTTSLVEEKIGFQNSKFPKLSLV